MCLKSKKKCFNLSIRKSLGLESNSVSFLCPRKDLQSGEMSFTDAPNKALKRISRFPNPTCSSRQTFRWSVLNSNSQTSAPPLLCSRLPLQHCQPFIQPANPRKSNHCWKNAVRGRSCCIVTNQALYGTRLMSSLVCQSHVSTFPSHFRTLAQVLDRAC